MHRLMADLMPQWQHGRIIEEGERIGNEDVEVEAEAEHFTGVIVLFGLDFLFQMLSSEASVPHDKQGIR